MNQQCRICLRDGALIPIFEKRSHIGEDIAANIRLCIGREISYIKGYPKNICDKCYLTLNETISFINTYNKTCAILANEYHLDSKYSASLEPKAKIEDLEEFNNHFKHKLCFSNAKQFQELLKPLRKDIEHVHTLESSKLKPVKGVCNNMKKGTNKKIPLVTFSQVHGYFIFTGNINSLKTEPLLQPKNINIELGNNFLESDKIPATMAETDTKKAKQVSTNCLIELPDNVIAGQNFVREKVKPKLSAVTNYVKPEQNSGHSPGKENVNSHQNLVEYYVELGQSLEEICSGKTPVSVCVEHKQNLVTDLEFGQNSAIENTPSEFNTLIENFEVRKISGIRNIESNQNLPKRKRKRNKCKNKSLCELCGLTCNSQWLHTHIDTHLDGPVSCPKCEQSFKHKYALKMHLRRKHGQGNFICSTCGNRFNTKGQLNTHFKFVHLKVTRKKSRYPCKLCGKLYSTAISALIHERSVHTGERPAVCSLCGSAFYHELYLKEHMRLHTGEKPYKCPVCAKPFAQRCNMKSHIKYNHRISDLNKVALVTIDRKYLKYMKP